MSSQIKTGTIAIEGDNPSRLTPDVHASSTLTPDQRKKIRQIGKTVRSYIDTARRLSSGKYAHVARFIPRYLSDPGNVLAFLCRDGVLVRFESNRDNMDSKVVSGCLDEPLSTFASKISQGLVHCHPHRDYKSVVPEGGMGIDFGIFAADGTKRGDLASIRVAFEVAIDSPADAPPPPQKPYCLLSVRNTFAIHFRGLLAGVDDADFSRGHEFLARSELRLPVGWDCIEVYPSTELAAWRPENAVLWAENDILAAVMSAQLEESTFNSLDPNASARQAFAALLSEYKALLDSSPKREETLQIFMREHPVLLCPSQVGMWPKLALGAHKTDFVFRRPSGDYLLVELERSTLKLFRRDGAPTQELTHAQKPNCRLATIHRGQPNSRPTRVGVGWNLVEPRMPNSHRAI